MRMKNKKSKRYSVSVFISGLLCILFLTTACKYRNNVKEFIEMEIAGGKSDDLVFYDEYDVSANGKTYVPSQKPITGTIPIENEYNLELSAQISYDKNKEILFEARPTVDTAASTPTEIKFTFQFEQDADASTQHPVGQEVPVTVTLIKKLNGTVFATKKFTIRCNTKPGIASVTPDTTSDVFTVILPTGVTDGDIKEARCTLKYTAADGSSQTAVYTLPISKFSSTPKQAHISAKTITKTATKPLALSARTLSLVLSDYAGLSSPETQSNNNYIYSSGAELTDCKLNVNSIDTAVSFTAQSADPHRFSASVPISSQSAVFSFRVSPGTTLSCTGGSYDPDNHKITITDIPSSGKEVSIIVTSEDEKTKNTYTLTVKKMTGVEISATDEKPWQKLKKAVVDAAYGDTIIINGTIKATSDAENSGEIVIDKNLTVKGKTGKDSDKLDAAGFSRIFNVQAGKTLTIDGLTLTNGKDYKPAPSGPYSPNGSGGCIHCRSGSLIISNTKITKNEAKFSGGIYISAEPNAIIRLQMNRVIISDNSGGGVSIFLEQDANLTDDSKLTAVTIEKNKLTAGSGSHGAGLAFATYRKNAILTLDNCTIRGNDAGSLPGGGVYISTNLSGEQCGVLNLTNGTTVTGNKAEFGAGIFIEGSTCNAENCTVSGNTATGDGGGIFIQGTASSGDASLTISGTSSVTDNTANGNGGGICVASGTFTIKGGSEVTVASDKNDVHLTPGTRITLEGSLSSNPAARITPVYAVGGQVLAGDISANYQKFTVTPSGSVKWKIAADGTLQKESSSTATTTVSTWTELKTAVENSSGTDTITISGTLTATAASDTIKVARSVTIQGTNKATCILDANSKCRIFKIVNVGALTLNNISLTNGKAGGDTDGGGIDNAGSLSLTNVTITNCKSENGKGGAVYNAGTLNLKNTVIKNCMAPGDSGGGIYHVSGTAELDGATIEACSSKQSGGGIYNVGTLTLKNNTTIKNCKVTDLTGDGGGGICNITGASATLDTVSIKSCEASELIGGGIANLGTLTVKNATIENCIAQKDSGGGIANSGTLTLTDTAISTCMAKTNAGHGGAIYTNDGTAKLTNVTINECTSDRNGGAIYCQNTNLEISGSSKISNCTAQSGGALYIRSANNKSVQLTGAASTMINISENKAHKAGGAVYLAGIASNFTFGISNCAFNQNSIEITDVTAGEVHYGGALYSANSLTLTDCTFEANYIGLASGVTSSNTEKKGATIYIADNSNSGNPVVCSLVGTLILNSEFKTGTTSETNLFGSGIFVGKNTVLEIDGNSQVESKTNGTVQNRCDIYLTANNGAPYEILGKIKCTAGLGSEPIGQITPGIYQAGLSMFTNTSQIPASRFTVTDESNMSKWEVDADGKLKKK